MAFLAGRYYTVTHPLLLCHLEWIEICITTLFRIVQSILPQALRKPLKSEYLGKCVAHRPLVSAHFTMRNSFGIFRTTANTATWHTLTQFYTKNQIILINKDQKYICSAIHGIECNLTFMVPSRQRNVSIQRVHSYI